jgi:peptidoglycan hydrolase-like protein with peptidoglycan-binding domain
MLRVLSEYNGSVPTLIPDGIYGNETRNAVILFQQNNGLPATGIVDQKTWEMITDQYDEAIIFIGKAEPLEIIMDPNKVYVLGDYSPNLMIAQTILYYLSGKHEPISEPSREGVLDNPTAASILSFQKLNALPATGNLDRKTWQQLSKQYTLNANREENL